MDVRFLEHINQIHQSYERLMSCSPSSEAPPPKNIPKEGVYLFSENGTHLYIGRSRNIRSRYGLHTRPSSAVNQASFAYLLTREAMNVPAPSYKTDEFSRYGLSKNPKFLELFAQHKARVRRMEFRYVGESDNTRQALLEIYCSTVLATRYNTFKTH